MEMWKTVGKLRYKIYKEELPVTITRNGRKYVAIWYNYYDAKEKVQEFLEQGARYCIIEECVQYTFMEKRK